MTLHRTTLGLLFAAAWIAGCASTPAPRSDSGGVERTPVAPSTLTVSTGECDERQAAISNQADERASPWSLRQHLAKYFPDMKVSWLMKETAYQDYVVRTGATNFGRCNDTGCYLFAAPTAVIAGAVEKSIIGESDQSDQSDQSHPSHDAAVLGAALGLPTANFEGPLRMFTIDLAVTKSCVRLPVDADPGVWKCRSDEDRDCFKFGGLTSGGVPELMVIDAPVAGATLREIR